MSQHAAVQHYSAKDLELSLDAESGSRYWSVALSKAMLTYFKVPPRARFEEHAHESEQITYVLAGTLVFEVGGREHNVGAGEVIAVPANVPHAVHALDREVEAVDAWSPPRESLRERE
jgi:quercetin dioxygenase-like cupin family protein